MDVRKLLGYADSRQFIDPDRIDELPASELTFALRLAANECPRLSKPSDEIHFEGAYVLQREPQTPAVPVVYLVRTETDAIARRIHQFVWNQNQAPFLIVESPKTIRVYSGFAYDREKDSPLLAPVVQSTAELLTKLADFRAESIDDGTLWAHWAHAVKPSERVDETLLEDLKSLDERLQKQGMNRKASHGLIGKFVYLRYLRDRNILSPKKLQNWTIDPKHVFTGSATLKAFRKVDNELQKWLNGSVFTLGNVELSEVTQDQLRLVAEVFQGGSLKGKYLQRSLFDVYDFSHIPIETLSCVYEQFLHDAKEENGKSRGKTLGAYYTPLPLADYVLSEMERQRPLEPGMKVLDPACGSGAFLVQCYRRLIEKQRRLEGRNLKKTELRELLTSHIFGIDRDDDACRIAELSLILTLLDYVEPPDLEDTTFKLPTLRGKNIHGPLTESDPHADFFDESGHVHTFLSNMRFDWIVGNPPWVEVKGTPPPDHEHYVAHRWMKSHEKDLPTSGNQIAEAFLWKAGLHLQDNGLCGMVVLAMTWFKKEGITFRQRFFSNRRVWSLANFANLAYVLFAGRSERPASVVFFDGKTPDEEHVIQTFAPFVAEQVANRPDTTNKQLDTWNIVVSADNMREVANEIASSGSAVSWKLAMWGTSRDQRLLERLKVRFQDEQFASLSQYGIAPPHEGLQLRTIEAANREEIEHHPELEDENKLLFDKLKNCGHLFAFPESAVGIISSDECYLRIRGGRAGLAVSYPPHIIVDAARRFAIYSDEFLAVPPRQIGIAGKRESKGILQALSLLLSSDFCVYHQFFNSPQWGIDANRADLSTLLTMPMPLARLSDNELNDWCKLQEELATSIGRVGEEFQLSVNPVRNLSRLTAELNDRVFRLLGLRSAERLLVEDFVQFHMQLNKGKVTRDAVRQPTPEEQQQYLRTLRDCLDGFISSGDGLRHQIDVLADGRSALFSVALKRAITSIKPNAHEADDPASQDLQIIRDRLRSQHSQWVYFDRALKVYDPKAGVLYQFKPMQRLHWTRRQAVLDADEIIAETLVESGVS